MTINANTRGYQIEKIRHENNSVSLAITHNGHQWTVVDIPAEFIDRIVIDLLKAKEAMK